jgi:hypothetical protein
VPIASPPATSTPELSSASGEHLMLSVVRYTMEGRLVDYGTTGEFLVFMSTLSLFAR